MYENLGKDLILRTGTETDIKAIKDHVRMVHGKTAVPLIDRLFKLHPTFVPTDNFLIEDTKTKKVVAYFCLKHTVVVLNDLEIPICQMEIVGTLEEYRNRGLIRKLNKAFEERVEEYQLPMITIIGIPYYYRKLGYEYGIKMGGFLTVPLEVVPNLQKDQKEPISIEEVTKTTFSEYLQAREKLNSYLDFYRQLSENEFSYLSQGNLADEAVFKFHLIRANQEVVGIFILSIDWGAIEIHELWVQNLNHLVPVLRFLKNYAKRKCLPLRIYSPSRPAIIQSLEGLTRSQFSRPYAWYVKIPSIKRFLETIKPIIEQRVEQSEFRRLTDSIRISWYHEGIELIFKKGKINAIKEVPRSEIKDMDINVPFPVIYQLLLGYRSFDELHHIYSDAGGNAIKLPIIRVVFPKIRALLTPSF
jgi:predicted N-acetyltransferase YhbS